MMYHILYTIEYYMVVGGPLFLHIFGVQVEAAQAINVRPDLRLHQASGGGRNSL